MIELQVLFLKIQVSLDHDDHVLRVERLTDVCFLCFLADIVGHRLHIDIHFLFLALKDTTGIVVVDNGVENPENIGIAVMILQIRGQECADIGQLPLVLLLVEADFIIDARQRD